MTNDAELERLQRDLETMRSDAARDQALIAALRHELGDYRRETQRQVRNLLSILRSVARRTAAEGEPVEEYQRRLDSRLAAITRVQSYILRRPDASVNLAELIVGELSAFGVSEPAGARIEGRSIFLKPVTATLLGLIFHELARLTIEGDEDRTKSGRAHVRWWVEAVVGMPDALNIEWRHRARRGSHGRAQVRIRARYCRECYSVSIER